MLNKEDQLTAMKKVLSIGLEANMEQWLRNPLTEAEV